MGRTYTSVYIDRDVKKDAEELFDQFGLSFDDAVNMFLVKCVNTKSIPFDICLPKWDLKTNVVQSDEIPTIKFDPSGSFDVTGLPKAIPL